MVWKPGVVWLNPFAKCGGVYYIGVAEGVGAVLRQREGGMDFVMHWMFDYSINTPTCLNSPTLARMDDYQAMS